VLLALSLGLLVLSAWSYTVKRRGTIMIE